MVGRGSSANGSKDRMAKYDYDAATPDELEARAKECILRAQTMMREDRDSPDDEREIERLRRHAVRCTEVAKRKRAAGGGAS